jgi:hypothetical protein
MPHDEVHGKDEANITRLSIVRISVVALGLCVALFILTAKTRSPAISVEEELSVAGASVSGLPNFVFLLADDLGWNSIGYENYDLYFATPNLDSLARKGIVMDNYYALEVCTPSRASLLTGRYPLSIGMQVRFFFTHHFMVSAYPSTSMLNLITFCASSLFF